MHEEVIELVMTYAFNNRFAIKDINYSPIKGPEGNIEYLIYMYKDESKDITEHTWDEIKEMDEIKDVCDKVKTLVDEAHGDLDK